MLAVGDMPVTIILRRDDEAKFVEDNTVLRYKELICVKTDTGEYKWKLGDGETPYTELNYVDKLSDILEFKVYLPNMIAPACVIKLADFKKN